MKRTAWFDPLPRPAVIAHRGASQDAPENTLAAFRLAEKQGADGFELDVTTCGSGELVVIHDADVDRTTSGSGRVQDLPLQEIKTFDAGSWFSAEFSGETVPTLDEVLETASRETWINIELKNYNTPFDNLAEQTAKTVARHGREGRVFFSSFNPLNARKIHRHLPGSPFGLLLVPGMTAPWLLQLAGTIWPYDALHPHFSDATPALIDRAHRSGKPVLAYTINDAEDIQRLAAIHLDGLITDRPALARRTLESQRPPHSATTP